MPLNKENIQAIIQTSLTAYGIVDAEERAMELAHRIVQSPTVVTTTTALGVKNIRAYVPNAIPLDGEYNAILDGDIARFELQGYEYEVKIEYRGTNIPCTVVVDNGIAEVFLK